MRENENRLCNFHPCKVDRIESPPGSSGNIGCSHSLRRVWCEDDKEDKKDQILERFGVNFITYIHPRSYAQRKKVHVSMCQVGAYDG